MPLVVEEWPVSRLVDYEKNPRKNDHAIPQMIANLTEFGFRVPVLAKSDGAVIDGHLRLKAARQMGMQTVPVALADDLTPAQVKAFRIAVNKSAEWASWDDDLLKMELGDLLDVGFDMTLTGFGTDDITRLLHVDPIESSDPDDIPDPVAATVTLPGDVWVLGEHRLMCGDSTNKDDLRTLMDGRVADLCFTSPPYAQQRDYKSDGAVDWNALMQGVFAALPVRHDAQVLVNLGLVHRDNEWQPYWSGWIEWMRTQGWRRFGWYVWDQGPGLPGDWAGRLAPAHEFLFHFNRVSESARKTKQSKMAGVISNGGLRSGPGDKTHTRNKGPSAIQSHKIPDSVIRITRHKGGLGKAGSHPAPFPVDLVSEMLTAFSDPGDLVFEPFCGSGTQLIAAQREGRACYGMEMAPEYADVCVRRLQNYTNQPAHLEGSGLSFDQIADNGRGAVPAEAAA